ncbi:hypothetical protein PSO31014_04446 [Pandoraea soli]|uniref:Uncharacterized protein n=1 Tax=Pandoraea soli TaxID=2508293 RepID=A0ABY6WAR1_9BURK|nr:hypothetical protein PSO31014_04446 [Pandoraea soli]
MPLSDAIAPLAVVSSNIEPPAIMRVCMPRWNDVAAP